MVADLTDTFRTCRTCLEWAASQESVKCEYVLPPSGVSLGVFTFEPNATFFPSSESARPGITWNAFLRHYLQNLRGVTAGCARNACTIVLLEMETKRSLIA